MTTTVETAATFHGVLQAAARHDPSGRCVEFVDGPAWTNAETERASRRLAAGLSGLGVRRGDRVAVLAENSPEFVVTAFAVSRLGAILVPLNTAMKGHVLDHMLNLAEAKVMITDAGATSPVLDAARTAAIEHLVLIGQGEPLPGTLRFDDLDRAQSTHHEPDDLTTADLFALMFTSGTSGVSKAVEIPHGLGLRLARTAGWIGGYTEQDTVFACLPLYHANALFVGLLGGLVHHAPVVVAERFSASQFWDQVGRYGATVTSLLGSTGPILWQREPGPRDRAHRLRTILMAPCPVRVYREFEARFGVKLTEMYGMTEIGIPVGIPWGADRPGAAGTVAPGWECQIVDEHGAVVPSGQAGEMVVRPLEPSIMSSGYWGMPAETVKAWRNLWFHTGDLMREEDGWFYYIDRIKDSLRRGGENIASFEVEEAIMMHPAVGEATVVGVASELAEDEVMTLIVLREGLVREPTPQELLAHCEEHLPYFCVPRYYEIVSSLPKTQNGKVQKARLVARGVTATTWDAGDRRRSAKAG